VVQLPQTYGQFYGTTGLRTQNFTPAPLRSVPVRTGTFFDTIVRRHQAVPVGQTMRVHRFSHYLICDVVIQRRKERIWFYCTICASVPVKVAQKYYSPYCTVASDRYCNFFSRWQAMRNLSLAHPWLNVYRLQVRLVRYIPVVQSRYSPLQYESRTVCGGVVLLCRYTVLSQSIV
jgi:hypothetical protein